MKYKESEYKYAYYRKNARTTGYTLHSKHMTKAAALKRKKHRDNIVGKAGYIKKLK